MVVDRRRPSCMLLPHSCFHHITWLPSPIHIAFLVSSTTRLQWHWYQMEDADTQSSTAAWLSRNCHHAQDYRQRIWSIRKATKHSLRCEYGILSIKREWFFHRAALQVYWSFSTCQTTQPYLQPLLFRVLFLLQCHYSLLEDESQIRRDWQVLWGKIPHFMKSCVITIIMVIVW